MTAPNANGWHPRHLTAPYVLLAAAHIRQDEDVCRVRTVGARTFAIQVKSALTPLLHRRHSGGRRQGGMRAKEGREGVGVGGLDQLAK